MCVQITNISIHEHVWSCISNKVTPILSLSHLNKVIRLQAFKTPDILRVDKKLFSNCQPH